MEGSLRETAEKNCISCKYTDSNIGGVEKENGLSRLFYHWVFTRASTNVDEFHILAHPGGKVSYHLDISTKAERRRRMWKGGKLSPGRCVYSVHHNRCLIPISGGLQHNWTVITRITAIMTFSFLVYVLSPNVSRLMPNRCFRSPFVLDEHRWVCSSKS